MSDLLKKIVQSQAIKEGRFYVKEDGKVYERIITAEDTFTGYYQNPAGTLFTEEGWAEEKERLYQEFELEKQKELQRAQEERNAAVAAKKERLVNQTIKRGAKPKSYKKIILGSVVGLLMLGVLVIGFWQRNQKNTTSEVTLAETEETAQIKEVPKLFGDALITGDDVNLRSGPSIENDIITSLGKMGERVEVIVQDSAIPQWEKIRREDGTQGWVYDLYLKKLDSLSY